MLDKIINLTRSYAWAKKVTIFFAVFAVTLVVMGGAFESGTGGDTPAAVTDGGPEEMTLSEPIIPVAVSSHDGERGTVFMLSGDINAAEKEINRATGTDEASEMEVTDEIPEKGVDGRKEQAVGDELGGPVTERAAGTPKAGGKGSAAEPDGFVYIESIPMGYELQEFTYQKCVERGLEYELVLAIMWRESRFNTNAVNINSNGTQDTGIMQINDVNRGWLYENYGISDLTDPYQNINAGTALLSSFAGKYGVHGAMMAYQYGEGGMTRRMNSGQTTSQAVEAAYRQRDYYSDLKTSE